MNWQKGLKVRVKSNAPLKAWTTFRIGGRARWFSQPKDSRELALLVRAARKYSLPVFILGAGSNILVSDKGVRGIVVKLDSPFFKKVSRSGASLKAGSGILLGQLIRKAETLGLSGLEFLSGIPGSLGGALAMNAGCWGRCILDLVEKAEVMDYRGRIKNLNKKGIRYGYRNSGLSNYIILGADLWLTKKDKAGIMKIEEDYLRQRRNSQDATLPNAGCIFKNPKENSAGKLIDLCDLRGRRIGNAVISQKHANFILNSGNAKSADVLRLMSLAKKEVKKRFNITLEPEIKIWK
jgi:UDP-N-acetylmuramate dehydrogenase